MTAPPDGPLTIDIYADSIRAARCTGARCGQRIWWAQVVKTGKQMCFDVEPVALVAQQPLFDDRISREQWTVRLDTNHWATCVDAEDFRRKRAVR